MANTDRIRELEYLAAKMREQIVTMMGPNKVHHYGGSLSAADIVTALYFYKMQFDPAHPEWPERDRFLMSKGHSVPAQYVALAMLGTFPMEELNTLKRLGTRLQGHPAMHLTPGIEGCTGALGEGLSYANGLALAARIHGLSYNVYCLMGDGELAEGSNWEAAMTGSHYQLDNLVGIVDRNHLQITGYTEDVVGLEPLADKWRSFGWAVHETDGHSVSDLIRELGATPFVAGKPSLLIADTVKGKGVSFIEGRVGWHHRLPSVEEYACAIAELDAEADRTRSAMEEEP